MFFLLLPNFLTFNDFGLVVIYKSGRYLENNKTRLKKLLDI